MQPCDWRPMLLAPLLALAAGCAFIATGADKDLILDAGSADDAASDAVYPPDDATGTGQQLPPQGLKLLLPWLTRRAYGAWQHQATVHESVGPHDHVREFFNDALYASLAMGLPSHPVGAAAVKEIYREDLKTQRGWAVALKLQADSDGGAGWYWFETLTMDGSEGVYADGVGTLGCTKCHKKGTNMIKSAWPWKE